MAGQIALSSLSHSPGQEKHQKMSHPVTRSEDNMLRREGFPKKPLSQASAAIACKRLDYGLST